MPQPNQPLYVLDGGVLLHRILWKQGASSADNRGCYVHYVCNKYDRCIVEFNQSINIYLPRFNIKGKVYPIDLARRPRETARLMREATSYDNEFTNISAAYAQLGQIRVVLLRTVIFFS